jgi:hypothetical protein
MRYLFVFFIAISYVTNAQIIDNRLNFILTIDGEIPTDSYIANERFLIFDKHHQLIDSFKIDYHVGRLIMNSDDLKKIFTLQDGGYILMNFTYIKFEPKSVLRKNYSIPIDEGYINHEYMMLNIYNKDLKVNREIFFFKPEQDYVHEFLLPGFETLIPRTRKGIKSRYLVVK